MNDLVIETRGPVGCITLNRPKALNALSLGMVRRMFETLLAWAHDETIHAVLLRGQGKQGPFGALCAGGDIRFIHQGVLAGDPRVEDFFTEEYTLDYLIHNYPKPYVAFMDGVVMGGGMGISQGAALRLVTERTRMAMPETAIGLFPDVAGGYFLSRLPGCTGEYLGLTGSTLGAGDAVQLGLADLVVDSADLLAIWDDMLDWRWRDAAELRATLARRYAATTAAAPTVLDHARINAFFQSDNVVELMARLEASEDDWAIDTAAVLRQRSPLMLHVVLELIRRARHLPLGDELRLERSLVRRCLSVRPGVQGETIEGIRALAIDKDHAPRWNPSRIEDVDATEVALYFEPAWSPSTHPLRRLETELGIRDATVRQG